MMDLRVVKTTRTEDGPSGETPENSDALGQEVPKAGSEKKSTLLLLPSWLEEHCVQRPDLGREPRKLLLVRETDSASDLLPVDSAGMPLAVDFEIEAAILRPISDAFDKHTKKPGLRILQLECPYGTAPQICVSSFLDAVVSHGARAKDALLITLKGDDVRDLADVYGFTKSTKKDNAVDCLIDDDPSTSHSDSTSYSDSTETSGTDSTIELRTRAAPRKPRKPIKRKVRRPMPPPPPTYYPPILPAPLPPVMLPVPSMLMAPPLPPPVTVMRKKPSQLLIDFDVLFGDSLADSRALIVHLSINERQLAESDKRLMRNLRDSLKATKANILLVVSSTPLLAQQGKRKPSPYMFGISLPPPMPVDITSMTTPFQSPSIHDIMRILRPRGSIEKINVVPASGSIDTAGWTDEKAESTANEQGNVRKIKRILRQAYRKKYQDTECPEDVRAFLSPYCIWDFLEGTSTQTLLREKLHNKELIAQLNLRDEFTMLSVKREILNLGVRAQAIKQWEEQLTETQAETKPTSKWASFSTKLREKLEAARTELARDSHCIAHFDRVVDPGDLTEGWTDVAVDSSVKDFLLMLTNQAYSDASKSRGILQTARIGGALLYGPPGTGKTHLARVLAKECETIMLAISPSDIQSMWVGESEHNVQALFKVAKHLTPCTIFLDEADSLFRARAPDDRPWTRDTSNQWLSELDNLKRTPNPPFVLLATNHPQDLDHAFHRRVPNRVFVGLPYRSLRVQLLKIYLKDDVVDETLNYEKIADRTYGYSGADIRNLCVQAALSCQSRSKDCSKYPPLSWVDFETAFQRSGPSVSMQSLNEIRSFAHEFDPQAVARIIEEIKPVQASGQDVLYE